MPQHEQSAGLWTKPYISLTLCAFLLFLSLQMLLSSIPAYAQSKFMAGEVAVSLITSVFAAAAIAARFLTAAMLKKIPRNVVLFVGLAAAGLSTALTATASSVGAMMLVRIGYGIGFGMASTIIPTLVSQIIPKHRMGEGIGYFGLSSSMAMAVGPMIGLNMMERVGFDALAGSGMLAVLLIFPILLLTRSLPTSTPSPSTLHDRVELKNENEKHQQAGRSFSLRVLMFPAALNVLLAVTYSGVLSFIALYGESVQLEQVGLFFLFNAVTILLVRPISGKVFDQRGHAAVLIPAAICVAASLLILSFAVSLPLLILSALLYGMGFGAIQPAIQAWMLRLTPPKEHSTANSMFYNSTDLGVAAGAIVLGAISSVSSYAVMYRWSSCVMLLFLLVYLGMHTKLKRRVKKEKTVVGSISESHIN